jgi:hypothetical protein
MIKTTLLSLSLVAGLASAAAAATVGSFTGDASFNAICSLGTSNSRACEHAVAEFRGGNAATNGTYEQSLNTPTQFGAVTGQFAWVKGTSYDFSLSHAANGSITFSLGSGPQTITLANPTGSYDGLSDANTMFIRIRNPSATDRISLTDMRLDGRDIGDLSFGQAMDDGTAVGAGSAGAGYLQVGNFAFSDPWTLTGQVTLDWAGARVPANSALGATFKLANVPVAPVPLPAAGLLMVAGLGGLALVRRRRA